jgi:transcriptional regulator with XRE-family HTH domain
MKLCIDYLRDIETEKGWTPYRIGKELGLSSARIYQLFGKGGTYDDSTAIKVAKILNVDPNEVVASAHAEREKDPEIKAFWMGLLEKISVGFESLTSYVRPRGLMLSA